MIQPFCLDQVAIHRGGRRNQKALMSSILWSMPTKAKLDLKFFDSFGTGFKEAEA